MPESSLFATLAGFGLRTLGQTGKQILPVHWSCTIPNGGKFRPSIRLAGTGCRMEQSCLAAMAVRMGWRAVETTGAILPTQHDLHLKAA